MAKKLQVTERRATLLFSVFSVYVNQSNVRQHIKYNAATKRQQMVARDDTGNRIRNMVRSNSLLLNPHIKHVTNVQKDIHVKLYGIRRTQSGRGPGYFESSYKVVQVPKLYGETKNNSEPGIKSVQLDANVTSVNHFGDRHKQPDIPQRTSTPAGDIEAPRLSSEFSRAEEPNDTDSDNLSDQQKDILNELDDTLSKYQVDDLNDADMPTIIADILPYGEVEAFNMDAVFPPDSSTDSDEPSSRTSSVSDKSINSRTGIISKRASTGSGKRKVNSVSFQLPEGHIDKPYSPMMTSQKPKSPAPSAQTDLHVPMILVSGSDVRTWHNDANYHVENLNARRNSSGPFKGSFMKVFYGRYGENDVGGYKNQARYLTPTILEKVESFESLVTPPVSHSPSFRINHIPLSITRRHTFR